MLGQSVSYAQVGNVAIFLYSLQLVEGYLVALKQCV